MSHNYPCYVYEVFVSDYVKHHDELVSQCTAIEWGFAEHPRKV